MKSTTIYFSFLTLFLALSSCDYERIRASGGVTSREVDYSGYSGLKVSNAFNAYITFSDSEERIEIEANENLHDHIVVEKQGDDLIVRLKRHTSIRGKATLNVHITTKSISDFDISGASEVTLQSPLVGKEAFVELSGASEFYGELDLDRLVFEASGSSTMNIFGDTGLLEASLSGSSELKDYDLATQELDIRLSGASDAYISVTDAIEVRASGASVLNYKGEPQIRVKDLSGASKLNKRD